MYGKRIRGLGYPTVTLVFSTSVGLLMFVGLGL